RTFKRDSNAVPDERHVEILPAIALHHTLHLSLLEVDPVALDADRTVLPTAPADAAQGDTIVVLGYPQNDSARNPLFVSSIFGNRFGVRRAAPGEVIAAESSRFYHDCSTLGGNSGSPVVSLKTGELVGVHRSADLIDRNESVPGTALGPFVQAHV